jgi:hypothetical protein
MELSNANTFYQQLINKIKEGQAKAGLAAAKNGIELIRERVIDTGINDKGVKFDPYSDTELPTSFIRSRSGSDVLKKKIEKKTTKVSYRDIRIESGLQVEHRDFKFTGRMWNNIVPAIKKIKDGIITISINAVNPDEKEKVKWNIEKSGNFLNPNKEELEKIVEFYQKQFLKFLNS